MAAVVAATPSEARPSPEKPTLTPPLSIRLPKTDDASSSELSDLEADDDLGEIEPDHYYGGGKVPVFKPVSASDGERAPLAVPLDTKFGVINGGIALQWKLMLRQYSYRPWNNSGVLRSSSQRSISMGCGPGSSRSSPPRNGEHHLSRKMEDIRGHLKSEGC